MLGIRPQGALGREEDQGLQGLGLRVKTLRP